MCRFLSGIAFKNGDVKTSDATDRHEYLIMDADLKDDGGKRNWVRVEYTSDNLTDLSTYKLIIDDDEISEWVTDNLKDMWTRKLHNRVKRMILVGVNKNILLGGKWILGENVIINTLIGCLIVNAGRSTIKNAGHSTIENAWHSTIENAGRSTIKDAGYSTIEDAGRSTIENAGNSTIKNAWNSTIKNAWHSTIENAWNSTIENAWNSTIENAGNSTIEGKKQ